MHSTAPTREAYLALANLCHQRIRSHYTQVTSCIESTYLLEQVAAQLGWPLRRVVCQATALTALAAQALAERREAEVDLNKPGYWMVGVGHLQFPDDFVGRSEPEKNRYVGHVVCLADGWLLDPSADQMHRPAKGLLLPKPLVVPHDGAPIAIAVAPSGAVVRYVLHPLVPVPRPRTDRILDRMARGLVQQWLADRPSPARQP